MAEEYGGSTGTYRGAVGTSGPKNFLGLTGNQLGGLGRDLFDFATSEDPIPDSSEEFDRRLLSIIDSSAGGFLSDSQNLYSKNAAVRDSQGLIASIFRDYKNTALPQIFNAQNSAGGYGSSTGQLLANDAFGAATAKASEAVLKNINDYRKIQQQDYGALADLFKSKSSRPTPKAASGGGGEEEAGGDLVETGLKMAASYFLGVPLF
jgi:hypothetical protein